MVWFKQLTTTTATILRKKLNRIGLSGLTRKRFFLVLISWIIAMTAVAYYTTTSLRGQRQMVFKSAAAAVNRLAEQSASLILEDDVLGLNRAISELAKMRPIRFAAIVNHENRILAHSDPERLNQLFTPLPHQVLLQKIDGVAVQSGKESDGRPVMISYRDIEFSGVRVGQVILGESAEPLTSLQRHNRIVALLLYGLVSLAAVGLLFFISRTRGKSPIAAPIPVSPETADGMRIGPYQLRRFIARGGMAELYLADYLRSDGFRRTVAIKKVLPHLVENQDFIKMFIREARLAALLQHPNIVQIFDFGKIQNSYFIAMEYIDGLTLGEVLDRLKTGLSVDMAVYVAQKICLGLDYSHQRKDDQTGKPLGIIHRDISPQNILISYQGEVKLSDFGISKATTEPSMTQAGVIKGKLSYLSPEQALGKPADRRSDIYALGLVIYEILSGKRLHQFESDIDAIRKIPEMVITPLIELRPDIPDQLNRIVMTCLEKDVTLRYQDAATLQHDLMQLRTQLKMSYDGSALGQYLKTTFQDKS